MGLDARCRQNGNVRCSLHLLSANSDLIDRHLYRFVGSPVFDPIDGFGGNGANVSGVYTGQFSNLTHVPTFAPGTGGGCVLDGPFASYNLSLGPGTLATNHCLQRGFNDNFAHLLTVKQLNTTLKLGNFEEFRTVLEGIPAIPGAFGLHAGAHFGVGGEMNDVYSSPGGPLTNSTNLSHCPALTCSCSTSVFRRSFVLPPPRQPRSYLVDMANGIEQSPVRYHRGLERRPALRERHPGLWAQNERASSGDSYQGCYGYSKWAVVLYVCVGGCLCVAGYV